MPMSYALHLDGGQEIADTPSTAPLRQRYGRTLPTFDDARAALTEAERLKRDYPDHLVTLVLDL